MKWNKDYAAQVLAIILALAPVQAHSMTSAELLQIDQSFATGYIWGVIEYKIGVLNETDPNFIKVRNCVIETKATADTFYEITTQYIRNNPEEMSFPAFGAIMNMLAKMCIKKR